MRRAILSLALLAGCSSPPQIEVSPFPAALVPPSPELPKIPADDLKCLSDDAYEKLALRDRLLRLHADELRSILSAP